MKRLRLGTRGSALAQAQSRWVAHRLREAHPGLEVDLKVIQTSGDRFSARPTGGPYDTPNPAESPNVKAMFVKEIEDALQSGEIDIGVHSAKDLPADLPEGLALVAIPQREDPRDAFVDLHGARFDQLAPGTVLATSSSRRRIQLGLARPGLSFVPMRGNVDTRLRKLKEGKAAGLVLAVAGLKRLGLESLRYEPLSPDIIVPSPGQGALAVEAVEKRKDVRDCLYALDHRDTRREVELERAFLRAVGGGCSTPLGALARVEGEEISFTAFWSDLDGKNSRRVCGRSGTRPEEISSLLESLLSQLKLPAS